MGQVLHEFERLLRALEKTGHWGSRMLLGPGWELRMQNLNLYEQAVKRNEGQMLSLMQYMFLVQHQLWYSANK